MGFMSYHSKICSFLAILFISAFICASPLCEGELISWRSPDGELSTLQIDPEDSFLSVISQIRDQFEYNLAMNSDSGLHPEFLIDFSESPNAPVVVFAKSIIRTYTPLTTSQKKDIAYIVTTLGNATITSIAGAKSSLSKAGDRIEAVHPMQFLLYSFSDEKIKAAIHNLRERTSWIKDEVFNGIFRSLDEESARNNLHSHVEDFASQLNLEYSLIYNIIKDKRWKDLINTLYTEVPRQGETDRYDM